MQFLLQVSSLKIFLKLLIFFNIDGFEKGYACKWEKERESFGLTSKAAL